MVAQRLEGRRAGDADCRRLFEGEVFRFGRELVFAGERISRERGLADAEHLIAGLEPGHVVANCLDNPREVHPHRGVLGGAQAEAGDAHQVRPARHHVPDAPIHAGRFDANQHLAVTDHRFADLLEAQDVRGSVAVLHNRLHCVAGGDYGKSLGRDHDGPPLMCLLTL